jgi:hypothetical protein
MKKLILILILGVSSLQVFAGGEQYMNAMKKAVAASDTAASASSLQNLSNQFQRIANVERTEWLPYYYAAYCIAGSAFVLKDKSKLDDYLDNAEALIKLADSLSPNNSEIYTIKAMINQGRIAVSPMSRGRKYGTISNELIKKAMELDSTNPRPYLLKGTGLFYTPSMFGGGKDKAKPILDICVKKYDAFKSANEIVPHWGRDRAVKMFEECNK